MHCFGLAVTVHKNVTTAEVEIWTHDTVDNKMFLVFLKKKKSVSEQVEGSSSLCCNTCTR